MEAKLVRRGDGLAIELPADEVERLGLREGQTVEVTPRERSPAHEPDASVPRGGRRYVDGVPVYTLAEMIEEMRRLGPEHEPETIDWGPDRGSEIIDDDDPR